MGTSNVIVSGSVIHVCIVVGVVTVLLLYCTLMKVTSVTESVGEE